MSKIIVTDHALVRYLERVAGLDLDPYRHHIASLVNEAAAAGAATITIDGYVYTLQGTFVTTVLDQGMRKKKVKNKGLRDRYGDRDDAELSYLDEAAE